MTAFAQYLGLKPEYGLWEKLELTPERDPEVYVDVHDVVPQLTRVMRASETPKLLIEGIWGSGKTHTLHYVASKLLTERKKAYHITITGLTPRSGFLDVYTRMMREMREDLESALVKLETPVAEVFAGSRSPDGETALELLREQLRSEVPDASRCGFLRSWLLGAGPTPTQALKLGLSGRLKDRSHHMELVPMLRGVARLIALVHERQPVLFLDESAAFQVMKKRELRDELSEGLRGLVDNNNVDVGVVIGLYETGQVLLRQDVLQRLGDRVVKLQPLHSAQEIQDFVWQFWGLVGKRPLFEDTALRAFAERAIPLGHRAQTPGLLTPRDLLQLLDRVVQRIVEQQRPLPISLETMQELLPLRKSA